MQKSLDGQIGDIIAEWMITPLSTDALRKRLVAFIQERDAAVTVGIDVPAPEWYPVNVKFKFSETVQKIKGSSWHGKIVGWYSTDMTPSGFAVESHFETGSVQIYPEAALTEWTP